MRKIRMFDVDQTQIELHPTEVAETTSEIDAAVFGIVSSRPLGIGNGFASPSRPFTYTRNPDRLKRRTTEALRLRYRDLEVTVVGTSGYWRKLVDTRTLYHKSIVGVRRVSGGDLPWQDLNEFTYLLSNFLGWLNHCAAPVFHLKAYRKGRLVYRGYDLYPHPTVQRDSFSWFPEFGVKDGDGEEADGGIYADLMQGLLANFATVWDENVTKEGAFHVALQLLRSGTKGGPRSRPSITYLRDTFTACAILEHILTGKGAENGRRPRIARCLKEIGVEDRLPGLDRKGLEFAMRECADLWRAPEGGAIVEADREQATMSLPLASIQNWLLHIEDPKNSRMLLGLGNPVQHYMVELSIWLADLMLMRVVGYNGWYFNRLLMRAEAVPWVN